MKQFFLRFWLTTLVALVSAASYAYDAYIDGIYYSFSGSEARVTYLELYSGNESAYSGEVVIPKTIDYGNRTYNVVGIQSYAFYRCADLTSVIISDGVTNIGDHAFYGCSKLANINIPKVVTSIGEYAFYGCSSLTSVDIPERVTQINKSTFQDCSSLTNVTIPEGVTYISIWAFYRCTNLKKVIIPESVTSIGQQAFTGVSGLIVCKSMTPPSVFDSRDAQFRSFSTKVYIPYGTRNAYESSGWYYYEVEEGWIDQDINNGFIALAISETEAQVMGYGEPENLTIPSQYLGYSVTKIRDRGFKDCKSLKTITLPNSIETIGENAFEGCENLERVELPRALTEISYWAFSGCSALKNVTIPSGVISIEDGAFSNCSSIESITIPGNCTSISAWAFYGCQALKAFYVNSNNTSYTTIDGVLTNDAKNKIVAYPSAKGTTYEIPNSITTIGENAFAASGIVDLSIPATINEIGNYAFQYCTNLKKIRIEDATSLITIGGHVFEQSGLECIYLGRNLSYSYYWDSETPFYKLTSLKNATLSNRYTHVDYAMFYGCTNLESVTLPETINTINSQAFFNCLNLKNITIPAAVTSIGSEFLSGCSGLQYINSKMETPMSLQNTAFTGVDKTNCKLIVPAESVEKYADTPGWMAFLDIVGENDGSLRRVTLTNNDGGVTIIAGREFATTNTNYSWYASANEDLVLAFAPAAYNTIGKLMVNNVDVTAQVKDLAYTIPANSTDVNIVVEYKFNALDAYDNLLYAADMKGYCGTDVVLPICLKNTASITSFQFDLRLPEGVTIATDSYGDADIQLATERTTLARHSLSYNEQSNGDMRVVCTSLKNATFSANDGNVVFVRLNIAEDMEEGDYPIVLSNIEMSEPDMTKHKVPLYTSKLHVDTYLLGDVDGDREVTVTDVTGVVNIILGIPMTNANEKAADVSGDGEVTVTDATGVVNIILGIPNSSSARRAPRTTEAALNVAPFNVIAGETVEVPIVLQSGADEFTGMQFDLVLPAGLRLVDVAADRRHNADFATRCEGTERIVSFSLSNATYAGNGTAALTLTLATDSDVEGGNILLDGIELVRPDLSNVRLGAISAPFAAQGTTSIGALTTGVNRNIYDLQGRKTRGTVKGVYMQNGQKVIK